MDDMGIARALHVLAVTHWIGGVTFVTIVLLPGLGGLVDAAHRLRVFEAIEGRFAQQARISTLIAGLSGLYMTWRLDAWARFLDPAYWWMHAMVGVWALFTVVLFVAEPLYLHALFHHRAERDPVGTFALVQRFHIVLLTVSLVAVGAGVLGAHGGL